MAEVPFRGSGHGGESPLSGVVARAWAEPEARIARVPAAPVRLDAVVPDRAARLLLAGLGDLWERWDLEARTERAYFEPGGPGPDPVRVTAAGYVNASAWKTCGGLSGISPRGFAQGGAGDGMSPGPLLAVLTEQAVTGSPRFGTVSGEILVPGQARERAAIGEAEWAAKSDAAVAGPLAGVPGVPGADGVRRLSGDELLGAMAAARRLANRAEWLELAALAEFARRRYAEEQAAIARRDPEGQRAGEFAAEEVAWATVRSGRQAGDRIELAVALAARLPRMNARMADGALDSYRAGIVHGATRELSAESVRLADAILAAEAPVLTPEALRKRAWQVVMTLDPDAARKRKKRGKAQARVEMWPEESGNAALAGREMSPEDALAANAYYDALARALRKGGVPGTLRELRHLAFTDRNVGKDPLDRIARAGGDSASDAPGADGEGGDGEGTDEETGGAGDADGTEWQVEDLRDDGYRDDGYRDDETRDSQDGGLGSPDPGGPGTPAGGVAAPPAANIHILVSAGTLLGWSGAPGEVSRLGPLDAQSTRDLVQSASANPATRWCVTVVGDDGTALAHGCARGQHTWEDQRGPGKQTGQTGQTGPPAHAEQAARVAGLLDRLGVRLEPIAQGSCDHSHREERYTPSRKLGHIIRSRTATCPAPGCGASAVHNDLDHTIPWPGGPGTCECNLGPPCRHHHRVKQAPGWRLDQAEPGVMRWTTPSGRGYETRPTVYHL